MYKVFISSVQREFAQEREVLYQHFRQDALLSTFFLPVVFERLPPANQAPPEVYMGEVGQSQLYLGLLGREYGYEDAEGISPTEREYDHATALGLERWIFIKAGSEQDRHPKEQAFIRKAGNDISWKSFDSPDDLIQEVNRACLVFLQKKGFIASLPFDTSLHPTATLDDLDPDRVEHFINLARSKRGFPLRLGTAMGTVLAHLNLYQAGHPTNSALLVFGRNPQQFFPAATIKCAHFHGLTVTKPIPDHKVFSGDVFEQVDQAVDFVLAKLPLSVGTRAQSVQAPVQYELPRAAVTEAIVNAVAHRDYSSQASVQVMLFADRLEIFNPGRLAPELSLARLKTEHASYPTNLLLAECMYQAGYIERFGTGTLEILRLSAEAQLHEPVFRLDEGFKVILWRPQPNIDSDQVPDKYRPSTGQVPDKYRTSTPEEQEVVKVMKGEMKSSEIQKALQLKHRETFRDNYLLPAIEAGLVEMTDPASPNSPKQRYRLTAHGQAYKNYLETL